MAIHPTRLSTLPEEWIYPFAAAWRVFERTLNDAFHFVMVCSVCGKSGAEHIEFVRSNKTDLTIIGLQCKCGNTIKFERPLSLTDEDFPQRLAHRPKTVLETNDHKPEKVKQSVLDEITELVFK